MLERSRQAIRERGWSEKVDTIIQEKPKAPINRKPASAYDQANKTRNQKGDLGEYPDGDFLAEAQAGFNHFGRSTTPHSERSPTGIQSAESESERLKADSTKETKFAAPEMRYTVPHLRGEHKYNPNPATIAKEKELDKLKEEIEILKIRKDEAEKGKDFQLLVDLTH